MTGGDQHRDRVTLRRIHEQRAESIDQPWCAGCLRCLRDRQCPGDCDGQRLGGRLSERRVFPGIGEREQQRGIRLDDGDRDEQRGRIAISGKVFVPQTPESYLYDLDGNLTNDGRDPIGELGGINLYAYVGNDALDRIDRIGGSGSDLSNRLHCIRLANSVTI